MGGHPGRTRSGWLLCGLLLFSMACAAPRQGSQAAAPSAPAAASPQVEKTITAAVGVPIIGFSVMGLYGAANNPSAFFELHTNGLATSDKAGRPIPEMARELPSLDAGTLQLL